MLNRELLRIALFGVSLMNVTVGPLVTHLAATCSCTGKGGATCTGDCCKTLASGECQCSNGPCTS